MLESMLLVVDGTGKKHCPSVALYTQDEYCQDSEIKQIERRDRWRRGGRGRKKTERETQETHAHREKRRVDTERECNLYFLISFCLFI